MSLFFSDRSCGSIEVEHFGVGGRQGLLGDYWVCEALRAVISHAGDDLVFKGGTSLEKMRLVQRFSEDLDLLVTGRYGNKRATERALKAMCEAAAGAIPGAVALKPDNGSGGEKGAEGADDSFWRKVYIEVPLAAELVTMGIADPTRIMLELGQAGDRHRRR